MSYPLVIVAGIPLGIHHRAKNVPSRDGWTIKATPSHDHKRADLSRIWSRVMEEADRAPDAGAHLLLAHDRESDRPQFRDLGCRCHRATWLSHELSRKFGQDEFLEAFGQFMNFEEEWRDRIRPGINSPLLLPETAFLAERTVKDAWSRARNVNRVRDTLGAVEATLRRFSDRHRSHGSWHDARGLIFRRGEPHGRHGMPKWRRQKFTFRLPEGFHFDVKHSRNQSFRIQSRSETNEFAVYTNIDPHGFIRGGR